MFISNRIAKILLLWLCFPTFLYAESPKEMDHKALYKLWGKIHSPLAGTADSIGSYNAGCLAGAKAIALDGEGYSVMKVSRQRYFGHPNLVEYLTDLGRKVHREKIPNFLVGDMGRPRGGPMISGHASHQVGLDVDIWFRMSKRHPKKSEREVWDAPSFVHKRKISKDWKINQTKLVELAASGEQVDRVFVNPVIKKYFCEKFPDAPWAYKLRAWWGHDDHLHVRLRCPEGNDQCQKQDPLNPAEKQCGADLEWFFSEEAKEELQKRQDKIAQRIFPDLPAACEQMVTSSGSSKP